MTDKLIKTPVDDLTYKVIGCAMAVHRELGPGLRENSYEKALAHQFTDRNISFEEQKYFEVFSDSQQTHLIGYYIPDFVVNSSIIVEIKAIKGVDNTHLAQVIGYLAVSGCTLGLLINFGERSLYYRRVLPPQKVIDNIINRQWLFTPDWLNDDK